MHEEPEGKFFPTSELKVLNLAKEFFRYGVEPRHLRMFNQFVGREASFIEQIIRPQLQHKDPNTKRSAIKDLENLMALSQMFIQALLREALSRYLPRPAALDILDEEGEGEGELHEETEAEFEVESQPAEAPYVEPESHPRQEPAPPPATSEGQMFPE